MDNTFKLSAYARIPDVAIRMKLFINNIEDKFAVREFLSFASMREKRFFDEIRKRESLSLSSRSGLFLLISLC